MLTQPIDQVNEPRQRKTPSNTAEGVNLQRFVSWSTGYIYPVLRFEGCRVDLFL